MSRPEDDQTRTSTATDAGAASDPALDATLPSPGNTPLAGGAAGGEASLAAGDRIGRYQIREILGSGGMGVVYCAHDPDLNRDLAIKVVQPSAAGPRAQQRLLEEARAMAKLRHPNIVPVFDVGATDRGVFIVMPLVAGGTLHDWLRAAKRPWRAVLDMFVAAGRGLAAAHAAGLVHRDVKPRNVFLGDAGEVLVGDFGIAAETIDSLDPSLPPNTAGGASTIAGTPAYMAPEQAAGAPIDARADQYSFCISLWEGLHGERPGQAETRTAGALGEHAMPRVPPDRRGAPTWLLAAVVRGFAPTPERRWPSMQALLRHIERRRARPRRVLVAVAGVVVAAGIAGATLAATGGGEPPCPDPRGRLAGIWDPAVRAQVSAALAATKVPFAEDTLARVAPLLDDYAARWRSMHVEACKATRVTASQSADLLDRRMVCLEQRLTALRSYTHALTTANAAQATRALETAHQLPPVADCADARALLAAIPMPGEPAVRDRILAIERQLAELGAARARGEPAELLARTNAVLEEARDAGHLPTLVRALQLVHKVERDNHVPGEAHLRELADTAARAQDDAMLAAAWGALVFDLAARGKLDEAKALEPVAVAALARAGSPPALVLQIDSALGRLAAQAGDYDAAMAHFEHSLPLARTSFDRRQLYTSMASIAAERGDLPRALELVQQALAAAEEGNGRRHPDYATTLQVQAQILSATGDAADVARAQAAFEEALAIRVAAFGESNLSVAITLRSLAQLANARQDYAAAEPLLRRALAIQEEIGDPANVIATLRALADTVSYRQGPIVGRPLYERALAAAEQLTGKDDLDYVAAEVNFAVDLTEHDCPAAEPYARHAVAFLEKLEHPFLGVALNVLARCALDGGRLDEGLGHLERALTLCRPGGCSPGNLEAIQWALGEQLVETRRDRARGLALLAAARAGSAALGRDADVAEIDAWVRAHRR